MRASEFYVGYLPIPGGLKKTMRRAVVALAALAAAAAAILLAGQHPFAPATFEFQQYREFRGALVADPYPALAIPGQGLPWLLVGPGKHGPGDLLQLDGREVQIKGERIFRGEDQNDRAAAELVERRWGRRSACQYRGPGPGATHRRDRGQQMLLHRDCAVRCISGGIPPAFLVRDSGGRTATLLLANWKRELLDHVAEPLTLRGHLVRSSGRLTLYPE